jgi:beta-glucuronidase
VRMVGFGRHEDFPIVGRGECAAVLVRDHACLQWAGANSYRTAHYPYSEVDLELADEAGLLVVSESPCVGLSFADAPDVVAARQAQALAALRELIERDACRTCVVAWSVCNEPGGPKSVPTADAKRQQTAALLELVRMAKAEGSRPVTFANIPEHCDEANRACDFLSLNEYASPLAPSKEIQYPSPNP